MPSDEEALQVWKYLFPRSKELGRHDIRGLCIINHQRGMPPLQRNHNVFRAAVIANAEAHDCTLMTTWQLYRLTRDATRLGWTPDQVVPMFQRNGPFEVVPAHYEPVGVVARTAPNLGVVGIKVTGSRLHRGDRIAFETHDRFLE